MKNRLQELLHEVSIKNKDTYNVYDADLVFFIVANDRIWESPNYAFAGCQYHEPLELVVGLTKEESTYLKKTMKKYEIDETFFSEYLEDNWGEYDEESALEYFEEDEDLLKVFKKMLKEVESGKTPFESMDDLVSAFTRYGLEEGKFYFRMEYEDGEEWVELHDYVAEYGEKRGYYEELSDEEWISILEHIDEYKVKA